MARVLNIANLLTGVRLLLVPVLLGFVVAGRHRAALAIFVCAAVTDALDGWVARHWSQESRFGAYLDPVADKLLLSGLYAAFGYSGALPLWLVFFVLGRDLFILSGVGFLAARGQRQFPPSLWGKLSTFLQILLAAAVLLRDAWPHQALSFLTGGLLVPVAVLTVWSGVHYCWRAWDEGIRRIDEDPYRE
ncbi:MAG: CDP-diacylglycerol--glycerol-3-phosphate 3-phosphatidyltransferase [Bryobacterales bacterium]|nr:CDP-diacylglycerol--glycerol-3-phosphate 3-phosphatidyltransferase [Bryobacterales bacterium]